MVWIEHRRVKHLCREPACTQPSPAGGCNRRLVKKYFRSFYLQMLIYLEECCVEGVKVKLYGKNKDTGTKPGNRAGGCWF